jgi:hypothetical protein
MSWSDRELDTLLREACERDPVDTVALERSIRARLRRRIVALQWMAAAAAIVLIAWGVSYRFRAPGVFEQAARDHRVEVVEHGPRHWRTDSAAIDSVASRFGFSAEQAARLAPAGYRLEHAKICGLDGKPALHLVYSGDVYSGDDSAGLREFSVYIAKVLPQRQKTVDGFTVAAFRSGLVVGTKAECEAVLAARI